MTKQAKQGHLLAFGTIVVWAITFVATTYVLADFTPLDVLLVRMVIAVLALYAVKPKFLKLKSPKHEWCFAGAGIFGVTLYFMLENYALTYTYSGNCSVIVSTAPFFVAIVMRIVGGDEKLTKFFFIGFVVAILGVGLIAFNGQALQLNPLGDLLSLLAAMSWAGYNLFIKKMENYGYDTLMSTRRIFLYGLLFSMMIMPFTPHHFTFSAFFKPMNLLSFLFLGLLASALCFVAWSKAISKIGAVKTSVYIYLSPVITIVMAWLLLGDPFLPTTIAGAVLALIGLVISQKGAVKTTLPKEGDL